MAANARIQVLAQSTRVIVPSGAFFTEQLAEAAEAVADAEAQVAIAAGHAATAADAAADATAALASTSGNVTAANSILDAVEAAAEDISDAFAAVNPSNPSLNASSRTILAGLPTAGSLPAILTEAGREGVFDWLSSDQSAQVTADPLQAIYIAPSSDTTGASGAWRRQDEGRVDIRRFGAKADGGAGTPTDNGPIFAQAHATLKALGLASSIFAAAAAPLFVPIGHYFMGTTTLEVTTALAIEGVGTQGAWASRLRWAAGTTGIRVQSYNTSGASGVATPGISGEGTLIQGLVLDGAFAGTEGEYHGIHMRGRAFVRDCLIRGWQGDGIFIQATAGAGTSFPYEGNANLWEVTNCWLHANRNGLYIKGADSNAGRSFGLNCSNNRQAGLFDSSFLGNTHIAPHFEENGVTDGVTPCRVTYSGNIYCCIVGQETGASTNAPSGTTADNTWWAYQSAGGANTSRNIRAWTSGTTYRAGGPIIIPNQPTARNLVNGMYTEGSEPLCQAYEPSMFLGGTWGTSFTQSSTAFRRVGATTYGDEIIKGVLSAKSAVIGPQDGAVGDTALYLDNTNSESDIYFRRNGVTQGRIFSLNFGGRLQVMGLDRVLLGGINYNTEQVEISSAGLTLDMGALGYRAGAGGAVTQATSRTTGVTLNKPTGAITLVSAAGSTSWQTFTVTNSTVAAEDTVRVCQKSGTDLHMIHVTNVAAGSFKISFATTGGTTTEQPVFNFTVMKGAAA